MQRYVQYSLEFREKRKSLAAEAEAYVKKKNAEMCIRGLAESLSNHRMICNGIIAGKDVILKAIFDTTVFLSSRYGQIMTGEVLKIE